MNSLTLLLATLVVCASFTTEAKPKQKIILVNPNGNKAKKSVPQVSGILSVIPCVDSKEPKCQRAIAANSGTIGSGVKFESEGKPDIRGGFVESGKLYLAIDWRVAGDEYGGIVEVDLSTGNRTLISGKRNDEEERGKGNPALNNVDSLGGINDVRMLKNGALLALVTSASPQRRLLIEVDVATGNRKLLWASGVAASAAQKTAEANIVKDQNLCRADPGPVAIPDTALAIGLESGSASSGREAGGGTRNAGSDNTVYLALSNNPVGSGRGIVKLQESNGYKCERVSSLEGSVPVLGTGFKPSGNETVTSMAVFEDKLLVLYKSNGVRLVSVELATGNRKRISDAVAGDAIGTGPAVGASSLSVATSTVNTVITVGPVSGNGFLMTAIDLTNGNRSELPKRSGSLSLTTDFTPQVFAVPDSQFLIVNSDNAIHVLDPKSGSSNILSL